MTVRIFLASLAIVSAFGAAATGLAILWLQVVTDLAAARP